MTETNVIRLREMPKRIPTNGTFELTVRCNLHCKMCLFRHADSENAALRAGELTAAQWIDMARQAAEAGTFSLLITGGEPMLRPDFCEIWEGVYRQGFLMELYTNATLVTPQIMETLRNYPPHRIGVTIYGASPATYEAVCGSADAFQRMLDGVRQLQTLPSVFEFRATLIRDNFADAAAIDALARQEFGVPNGVKQACPINKAVRGGCADVEACRIPPEEDMRMKTDRLENSIREIIGPGYDRKNLMITRKNHAAALEPGKNERPTIFGCEAGMSQYTITYDGRLLACQMIGAFSTDAAREGLQTAWEQYPREVHIPYAEGKCGECGYVDTCQACYGTRYAETGDFNGCSEYIYQTAKARKEFESFAGGMSDGICQL